ncbi:hypothetical protein [Capnocytophaga catalasegens]|uniref:Uncharacterized protein n=1 Tax=Capnocytophaga catalasegens TaxID=1004260 RepID=A0AAV5B1A6_9FLAO|nr:hypothetical protein [Capnocytophaga catalasegens]GIZ16532.1 hypothetical protein RCZ03_25320 [Capnocytophaga catalasegens]GJM51547.1 hypothetical protein RCZ15_25200 [Capnocytophaga catalasegens]GJM52879.1 hypothetical protein RCZ16_11960 [Capnocytophaga catalasegens]
MLDTKIKVVFSGITLNTERQLVEGKLVTTYDRAESNVVGASEELKRIENTALLIKEEIKNLFDQRKKAIEELEELNKQLANKEISKKEYEKKVQAPYKTLESSVPKINTNINELLKNEFITEADKVSLLSAKLAEPRKPSGSLQSIEIPDKNTEIESQKTIEAVAKRIDDAEEVEADRALALLLKDPLFKKELEKLKKVREFLNKFYENCQQKGLTPGKEPGIVPMCFWELTPENVPYYTMLDLPFYSGVIDGTYSELVGLYQLGKYLSMPDGLSKDVVTFAQKYSDFVYAYTIAYLLCSTEQIKKSEGFYQKLTAKLEKENKGFGELVTYPYEQAQRKLVKMQLDRCEESKKLREEVSEFVDFISNVEELQKIVDSVSAEIKDCFETISGLDNRARYEQGRLVIPLLTIIVPITKATKLKDFVAGLRKISPKNLANHIKNLAKKGGDDVARIGGKYWKQIQKITNKYPTEKIPVDGQLWGIAEVENGIIKKYLIKEILLMMLILL